MMMFMTVEYMTIYKLCHHWRRLREDSGGWPAENL